MKDSSDDMPIRWTRLSGSEKRVELLVCGHSAARGRKIPHEQAANANADAMILIVRMRIMNAIKIPPNQGPGHPNNRLRSYRIYI